MVPGPASAGVASLGGEEVVDRDTRGLNHVHPVRMCVVHTASHALVVEVCVPEVEEVDAELVPNDGAVVLRRDLQGRVARRDAVQGHHALTGRREHRRGPVLAF